MAGSNLFLQQRLLLDDTGQQGVEGVEVGCGLDAVVEVVVESYVDMGMQLLFVQDGHVDGAGAGAGAVGQCWCC